MLQLLRIQHLALIDSVSIPFRQGLTALTGESGAGKSMVLDALALVAGGSHGRLKVRTGHHHGFVEAEFLPARTGEGRLCDEELCQTLSAVGFDSVITEPGGSLILARRLDQRGRSRCFFQGQTVSRTTLARIAAHLIEICGQSEAHHLRTSLAQLKALDRFADVSNLRIELERTVTCLREQESIQQQLADQVAESERREDFVRYQLEELKELNLCELCELVARKAELDALCNGLESCQDVIKALGPDGKLLSELRWLSARLGSDSCVHSSLKDQLEIAIDALCEAEKLAKRSANDRESHRFELAELERQLSQIEQVANKHRVSMRELSDRATTLERELVELGELRERHLAIDEGVEKLRNEAMALAERLHRARAKFVPRLVAQLEHQLRQVGLRAARCSAELSKGSLTCSGVTRLELGFSANPGHPTQPLSRVASGGELSRVLLAFRLATDARGGVLLFDEIDAGAGGKTAEKIAACLAKASQNTQVIAVTHWPQVAGAAAAHLLVDKDIEAERTTTTVYELSSDQRVDELGRMLGGDPTTARHHALGLMVQKSKTDSAPLDQADNPRKNKGGQRLRGSRVRAA